MIDFVVPSLSQSVRDLELVPSTSNVLYITEAFHDLDNADRQFEKRQISALQEKLDASDDISLLFCSDEDWFCKVYSCVRFFESLGEESKRDVVRLLCDATNGVVRLVRQLPKDETQDEGVLSQIRTSLKVSVYLLAKLLCDEEERQSKTSKKASKNDTVRGPILECLLYSLKNRLNETEFTDFGALWSCGVPEESFLDLFWRTAETVALHNPKIAAGSSSSQNSTTLNTLVDLISIPVHKFHATISHLVAASFSHTLNRHESMPSFVVSVLKYLTLDPTYQDDRLARLMILEVGRIETHEASRDTSGVKFLATFIESLSSQLPALVLSNLSVLLGHLNAHAYPLRNAIVRSLTSLVIHLKETNSKEEAQEEVKFTRDKLFDLIGERVHDTSSYVRAVAISSYTQLILKNALPLFHIHIAVDIGIERLLDKSSLVRKQAIACLSTILENNPFSDRLNPAYFGEKLQEAQAKMPKKQDEEDVEGSEEDSPELDPKLMATLTYYKSALTFAARMEFACKQMEQLVCSKTVNDVVESVRFLGIAVRFKLPAAENSLRRMFSLIWDDRESGRIKKELLEVFEVVFVSEPVQVGRSTKRKLYPDSEIAKNLIGIVREATLAELTSLEKIISECVDSNGALGRLIIPHAVVEKVWEEAYTKQDSAAMCLVSLMTRASKALFIRHPSNITKLMTILEGITLDFELARYGYITLGSLVADSEESQVSLGEKIERNVSKLLLRTGNDRWFAAAEEGIRLVAMCSKRADHACARMVRRMHKALFSAAPAKPSQLQLSQFLFVVGQVGIQLFVYSEAVAGKAKRKRKGVSSNASSSTKSSSKSTEEEEEMMMLGGGELEDFEDTVLERIAEVELVDGTSLLGMYIPLVIETIKKGLSQDEDDDGEIGVTLMESSSLALCKLLCLSQKLCERHIRFLFTVLRDSRQPSVRSNVMIAVGDLAVRFPNTVEPYTSQIYMRLRDPNVGVRKTSLMVLTHLILNDMIKVRGEVFEIALCLEDEQERIRDLACLFFHELGRKGLVYNLLTDIINKISKDAEVSPRKFQRIAKFLLQFITAEKHIQGITDKLCHRMFAATGLSAGAEDVEFVTDLKETQDLAYCLAQLKFSHKALQKLVNNFKLYQALLADDVVYDCLQTVMKRARQAGKAETKEMLQELNDKMDLVREKQLDNKTSESKADSTKGKKTSKTKKQHPRKKKKSVTTSGATTRVRRSTRRSMKENVPANYIEEEQVA